VTRPFESATERAERREAVTCRATFSFVTRESSEHDGERRCACSEVGARRSEWIGVRRLRSVSSENGVERTVGPGSSEPAVELTNVLSAASSTSGSSDDGITFESRSK
jgi:hypothetical protein